jgi:hypothetical protein
MPREARESFRSPGTMRANVGHVPLNSRLATVPLEREMYHH